MALTTISTLAESYTSGVSPSVADDAKDEEADLRMDEDLYQLRSGARSKREPTESRPKDEISEDEEGSDDSDEILEVIG